MKEIQLTKGYVAIVDDEDFEFLSQWKWHYNNQGYAVRMVIIDKKHKMIMMHRLIMDTHKGLIVDHINHDKLDNRKPNLRNVTVSQNQMNAKKRRGHSWSKYKGVTWNARIKRWKSNIRLDGKLKTIGHFKTEEDAAQAYNFKAIELFGEHALLNGGAKCA